ncbi:MAG: metallophosphoesterase [Candidatus Dojkabacteria bacterium]|nr:metallophosphoesterase [Candidatus Dojkabacteria bacterium]MDQ7020470.1 metallophosphoesterase [Candidatus Dojkabacteria bacterium]
MLAYASNVNGDVHHLPYHVDTATEVDNTEIELTKEEQHTLNDTISAFFEYLPNNAGIKIEFLEMEERVLVLSDIHLMIKDKGLVNVINSLEELLNSFQSNNQEKIGHVVINGDFFDGTELSADVIGSHKLLIERMANIVHSSNAKFHLVIGDHDRYSNFLQGQDNMNYFYDDSSINFFRAIFNSISDGIIFFPRDNSSTLKPLFVFHGDYKPMDKEIKMAFNNLIKGAEIHLGQRIINPIINRIRKFQRNNLQPILDILGINIITGHSHGLDNDRSTTNAHRNMNSGSSPAHPGKQDNGNDFIICGNTGIPIAIKAFFDSHRAIAFEEI